MAKETKSRGARGEGKTIHLQKGPYAGQYRRVIYVEDASGVKSTRSFTRPTKTAAVKAAREWQESHGLLVPVANAARKTVSEVVQRYLQDFEARHRRREISPNNLAWYARASQIIQNDPIAKVEASKVKGSDVDQMVERLLVGTRQQPKLGPEYVKRIRAVLNQAMVIAVREGVVTANPVARSRQVKVKRAKADVLSTTQARRLLDAARHDRLYAFFVVLFGLGLRRGEACGLKWSDIDFDTGVVKIRRQVKREPVEGRVVARVGDLKTSESSRDLPLPAFVAEALEEHRLRQEAEREEAGGRWKDEDWVFTSPTRPGQHLDPSHAYRRVTAAARSVGINDLTVHKIRHAYLTALALQGAHPSLMQAAAGHADPSIALDIYTHVGPEAMKAVADAADRAFGRSSGS